MDDLSTVQVIVLLVSPALAAVAAAASWASVIQSRKLAREATAPDFSVQLTQDGLRVGAAIHNGGGGPSRGTGIILSGETGYAIALTAHGVVRPGETFLVTTEIPVTDEHVKALVMARDRRGFLHTWTNEEDHTVRRPHSRFRRKPQYADIRDRFREAFPKRRDPHDLQQVPASAVKE